MTWLSENELWEAFATRALFYASYGGADFGECRQTVARVGDGSADDWWREWGRTAGGLMQVADAAAGRGHRVSAREAYLRASTYYRTSYFPLYGAPTDPRLPQTLEHESAALARAVALWDSPVELLEIPFGETSLPGLLALPDASGGPFPTVVHVNGYDSNINEGFVAHAPAALSRGYALLLFDGPGQGRPLIRDGLAMRPDWERVVGPVLDLAVGLPVVDPDRIVLAGWSFGGFLAPRAAAFEAGRIAALWADPGQWDLREAMLPSLPLTEEERRRFPDVDPAVMDPMEEFLRGPDAPAALRWRLIQRGLWVHGKETLYDYFAEMTRYELSPVAADITCPTLLTMAEGDPIAAGASRLIEAIGSSRKTLIAFGPEDGAAGHCEGEGRRLFHQRCYDWLDEVLAPVG